MDGCSSVCHATGHFGTDALEDDALLRRRQVRIQALDQAPCDRLVLLQDGSPRRLGGMRREHRFDLELAEQLADPIDVKARAPQSHEDIRQTARLRHGQTSEVVAAPPDAMDLLGQIDDLKIGRKAAHQRLDVLGVHLACCGAIVAATREGRRQLALRGLRLTTADGLDAGGLDRLVELDAALIANHLADQSAEDRNVVAKRFVFGRETLSGARSSSAAILLQFWSFFHVALEVRIFVPC